MLTDLEIAEAFERAAEVLRHNLDTADADDAEPGPYDRMRAAETDETDPWGGTDAQPKDRQPSRSRQAERSAPRGSARGGQASSRAQGRASGRSAPAADIPTEGEHTDSNGKTWFFGDANAPDCDHRMPAAYVTGEKRNGDEWHAWACPIGFGKNWKDKCDLWEFTR
jgi:hypothetical protein